MTLELAGYEREIRQLTYRWSEQNVALAFTLVGLPAFVFWGKVPEDLVVRLAPLPTSARTDGVALDPDARPVVEKGKDQVRMNTGVD